MAVTRTALEPLRVQPVFGGVLAMDAWGEAHRAGLVPDAVPYGLDRMEQHGVQLVRAAPGWHSTLAGRRVRGAVRRAGGGLDWALTATPRPRADAVLSWDERSGLPLALAHGRRVPVVTNVIWLTDAVPRAARPLVRASLRRAARVTVLSSAQVPVLTEELGVAPDRVRVVPFGVDADFFTPSPDPARARDVEPDHVVCVGNDRDRDWSTALDAFASVRARRPGAQLTVVSRTVGDSARGCPGVAVVPHLDHASLRTLLRRASAAMVLTRPNVHVSGITAALEAQAVGVPVVVSGTPGMADYAITGGGMVLVRPGDAAAAGHALVELLADIPAASERGARGRVEVERRFSTEVQASRLAEVVHDAVAN